MHKQLLLSSSQWLSDSYLFSKHKNYWEVRSDKKFTLLIFDIWHLTLDMWTFEYLNIWPFEYLNIWQFEHLNIWTIEHLNIYIWTFEHLNIWTFEHLNIWTTEHLNIWTRVWHSWKFCHKRIFEYIDIKKLHKWMSENIRIEKLTRTNVRINICIENCKYIQIFF